MTVQICGNNSPLFLDPTSPECVAVPVHFILQSLLLVFIILTNVMVVVVTAVFQELHTPTNIGITSLAMADLLLGVSWFYIQVLVFQHGTMITNIHPAYRDLQDLAYVFEMSVILHILLVTGERFLAVVWPLSHYQDLPGLLSGCLAPGGFPGPH